MNAKTIFKNFHDHSYVANEICTVYGEKAFLFSFANSTWD